MIMENIIDQIKVNLIMTYHQLFNATFAICGHTCKLKEKSEHIQVNNSNTFK